MAGLGEWDTNKTLPNHVNVMFTKSKHVIFVAIDSQNMYRSIVFVLYVSHFIRNKRRFYHLHHRNALQRSTSANQTRFQDVIRPSINPPTTTTTKAVQFQAHIVTSLLSYFQDLIKDMKSELSGDFKETVLACYETPARYDAWCVKNAIYVSCR